MRFTASRLSEGNQIFPDEINIDDTSVTIKSPKLFGGKSKSFPLGQISVSINTPMVGFSDITLFSQGTGMSVHGFTSSDAKSIKYYIEKNVSDQKEEARKREKAEKRRKDDEWRNERENDRNSRETESSYGPGYNANNNGRSNHRVPEELDDDSLNLQALNNMLTRLIYQVKSEGRKFTELEHLSIKTLENTLKGNGKIILDKWFFASSTAHFCSQTSFGIDYHHSAWASLNDLEEYWMMSKDERSKIAEEKTQKEKEKEQEIIQKYIEEHKPPDPLSLSLQIKSHLESETGEKFDLIPEFEKFSLSDEPVQIGYLLTNANLQSTRLNFTEDGILYSVTYWHPAEKVSQFANHLAHLSIEKAMDCIVNYFKNPKAKQLIEYSETEYEYSDPDEIGNKYDEQVEKLLAGNINSLIITAEPDRYKSDFVECSLRNGDYILKSDEDYFTITGELSGLELYGNLNKYNGKLLIIKDSDTSLRDENFVKIFQQAVDPKAIRPLRRPHNRSFTDSAAKVPVAFEFTGKIILISAISKKKFTSLLGKQSNFLEVVLKKQNTINCLWGWLPGFERIRPTNPIFSNS